MAESSLHLTLLTSSFSSSSLKPKPNLYCSLLLSKPHTILQSPLARNRGFLSFSTSPQVHGGRNEIQAMTSSFGSRLEENVKKTIAENPVVIYSKDLVLVLLGGEVVVQYLCIKGCSEDVMDLPDWIGTLTSLEYLAIEGCKNRKVLSKGMQHLTALRKLTISGCDSELEKRCKKDTGEDWSKIAHVLYVDIRKAYSIT